MNKITVQEAINLPAKAMIDSITATVKAAYAPEQGKGYDKDIQVQNLILTDGTTEIRAVLVDPALFITDLESAKGQTITLSCSPALGGPSKGQLTGVSKQVDAARNGNVYHKVRCTGKCVVQMGAGSGGSHSGAAKSSSKSSSSNRPKLPFSFYVQDYLACLSEARKMLGMDEDEDQSLSNEDLRAITTGCMISAKRGEDLLLVNAEKLFAKDWKTFRHPQFNLTLAQMHSKDRDKFIDTIIIPAITGVSDSVPKPVIKAALPDLKIELEAVAYRWAAQNGITDETLAAFIAHQCPDGAEDGDWVQCIDPKMVKQIQSFAPPEPMIDDVGETSSDW